MNFEHVIHHGNKILFQDINETSIPILRKNIQIHNFYLEIIFAPKTVKKSIISKQMLEEIAKTFAINLKEPTDLLFHFVTFSKILLLLQSFFKERVSIEGKRILFGEPFGDQLFENKLKEFCSLNEIGFHKTYMEFQ